MAVNLFGEEIIADVLLRDKFLEPPFSILDSKGGAWQNRKRQWKAKGIKSEVGRAGNVFTGAARAEFDKDDTPAQDVQPSAVEELFKEDAPGVYAGDYIVSWTYDIHEKDGCLFNPRFTGSKSDCENYINQNKP